MQRDVERIENIYAAFRRRKLPDILQLAALDIEVSQSTELLWGGTFSGHEGLKQFLFGLAVHLDSQVEIERIIDLGDHVVVIDRTVGKARATGLEYDVPVVHVWTVREGRIVRFQPRIDNAAMLAALGM